MKGRTTAPTPSAGVFTIPNAITLLRLLLLPACLFLLVQRGSELTAMLSYGLLLATDWVDGFVARRIGQQSVIGKVLDPAVDRVVIVGGLITLVARGAFPLWAAAVVVMRDVIVFSGAAVFLGRGIRIDVRWIGKAATFGLMFGISAVAWANLNLPVERLARLSGWTAFWLGVVAYYVAAVLYAVDLRRALRSGSGAIGHGVA